MSEQYPTQAQLLALDQDPVTGVEMIPTGRTPYYLEFRKLMHRLLLVAQRGNDFRVYAEEGLNFGVRAGRCVIQNQVRDLTALTGQSVDADSTTHVWLDATGSVQTATNGLPTDRTSFVPLAAITSDSLAITDVQDLRGEAIFNMASLAHLGLTATTERINQLIDGTNGNVTAAALNNLTAGSTTPADTLHTHLQIAQDVDGYALFTLLNSSNHAAAELALVFSMPGVMAASTVLQVDRDSGFLTQQFSGQSYHLLGTAHLQTIHAGALTATQSNQLVGIAPVSGAISRVILSIGNNLVTDEPGDNITAVVKANGTAVTATSPKITVAAGSGSRCTDQGDGTASVMKTDGSQIVHRGDMIHLDLQRTVNGNLTSDAEDVTVLLVINPAGPE